MFKNEKFIESAGKVLAVLSFLLICWVFHRALDSREECLHSDVVLSLKSGAEQVLNCNYESRLSLQNISQATSQNTLKLARRLEALNVLKGVIPGLQPRVEIRIDREEPFSFKMTGRYLNVGEQLAMSEGQFERAVVMTLLQAHPSYGLRSHFDVEVTTDFLLLSVLGQRELEDPSTGDRISWLKDMSFAVTDRSLNDYCYSSWRSLAHFILCTVQKPGAKVHDVSSWGARPLLAKVLMGVYQNLSLKDKMTTMRSLLNNGGRPHVNDLADEKSETLALWVVEQAKSFMTSWGLSTEHADVSFALKKSLMLERVFPSTQWDYSVQIIGVPSWERLWLSLRQWSKLHPSMHILVYSPLGVHALPEGREVNWAPKDVRAQKHVLIACDWPSVKEAVKTEARQFTALQVCEDAQIPEWYTIFSRSNSIAQNVSEPILQTSALKKPTL